MYICICNAITEEQIKNSVELGASSLSDLQADLGIGTCCGSCSDMACSYIKEHSISHLEAVPQI